MLEHLADPGAALERIAGLARARRGGLLVGVPNLASLQARVGGERWYHLDVPRHRIHFTPAGLTRLLERSGFAPVGRPITCCSSTTPTGCGSRRVNRLTRHPSYLYNLLKRNAPLGSRDLADHARWRCRWPRSPLPLELPPAPHGAGRHDRGAGPPAADAPVRVSKGDLGRQLPLAVMEGSGFGGLFGDPDDLQRRLGEFAEQMQGAQRLAWADNAIKLAVDLTVAAMNRANIQGTTEQQAEQLRSVMAVIFPEAVTLVREAREGLQ